MPMRGAVDGAVIADEDRERGAMAARSNNPFRISGAGAMRTV